jgi:hypothetical protein
MLAPQDPRRDGNRDTGRADRSDEAHLSNSHRLEEGGQAHRHGKTRTRGRCESPEGRNRISADGHPDSSEYQHDQLGAENERQRADTPGRGTAKKIPDPVSKRSPESEGRT